MFDFVYVLRAIATILITNSHYGNIWPISTLATGGLLGNVIFLAISGFCLYHVKFPFHVWYIKRIGRIYPVLWTADIVGIILGVHKIDSISEVIQLFIYPKVYHFIASIMILYVLYYFLITFARKIQIKIEYIIIIVAILYLIVYVFKYDYSYYHIDVVEEPMILFLFIESMLLGAYFRDYFEKRKDNLKMIHRKDVFILILSILGYFMVKALFSRYKFLVEYQIVTQLGLFIVLYYLFIVLCSWECHKKRGLGEYKIGVLIKYLSEITLEIYLVQYFVFRSVPQMIFPLNFIIVTCLILILATFTNYISKKMIELFNMVKRGKYK